MPNRLLIGASGHLGRYLATTYQPIIAHHRFENSELDWRNSYESVDEIWLVARCCRKEQPRRDYITFVKEISGITKICRAFPKAHIVYTSTKVVYGKTVDEIKPVSRKNIGEYFINADKHKNETIDLPFSAQSLQIKLDDLNEDHRWYATTKLTCEQIIRQQTHTILRIWDIEE